MIVDSPKVNAEQFINNMLSDYRERERSRQRDRDPEPSTSDGRRSFHNRE